MSKPYRIRWEQHASPAVNARRELPKLVTGYFADVRKLLAEDPPPDKLHAIRLETKRLRYTLELFRPRYGPGLDTRLAALRGLQQLLGEVNDNIATAGLIDAGMGPSPQRAKIARFLAERTADRARQFRAVWAEVFDAPGQELWWTRYLSRNAR